MKNSGTFVRTLQREDANSIVILLDFNQILMPYQEFTADSIVEHTIILEDLQVKVGLFSLLEAGWPETNALATQSAEEAALAKIKKEGQKVYFGMYHAYGNGPWIKKGEEILQNKNSLEQPWALMAPYFSTNTTALLDEDLKIGVKVESKAQGVGGLKNSDYLTVFGSWRKSTNIRKKKDNDIEILKADIEALKLAISGRLAEVPANTLLGRNSSTGIVEAIPQSTFAKPSDINIAISNLVGGAPGALNTLDELAAALDDDANFASSVINQLAGKAPLLNPVFSGFTTLGGNIAIKQVEIIGTTGSAATDVAIAHGITGTIRAVTCIVVDFFNRLMAPGMTLQGANNEYYVYTTLSHFVVYTAGSNSSHVVNRPFKALITYSP